jgi:polyhydroxyalkanoate synthesis regulator phasin
VALFTPAIKRIFNLIPADYGRPLGDITSKLGYHGLAHDVETVLDKLTTLEKEVSTAEEKIFLMRISPYRTAEDRIDGVVITFVDITTRKEREEQLRQNIEELGRFNKAMVSRESRMIELKKEINELCQRLGEPDRYPLKFENQEKHEDV